LFSVEQTSSVFERWLAGLRDQNAYTRVRMQLLRFGKGQFGDVKPVGEGVSETRLPLWSRVSIVFLQERRRQEFTELGHQASDRFET
jgi:putative addiction module killer protein